LAGPADLAFHYGPAGAGWLPLAGDWNGDTVDTVGLYASTSGSFYLRNEHAAGRADLRFTHGPGGSGWLPVVGDWDGPAGEPLFVPGPIIVDPLFNRPLPTPLLFIEPDQQPLVADMNQTGMSQSAAADQRDDLFASDDLLDELLQP